MRATEKLTLSLALAVLAVGCGKDSQSSTEPTPTPGPQNASPDAKFSFQCASRSCDFNESSTDADGSVSSWSWNFGDDSPESGEPDPSHTFAAAGSYAVSLTVTDDKGATNTQTKQVDVTDPVVTSLSCVDGSAPGGFVSCKLKLEAPAGYKVVLNSHSCTAHGNVFRITEPVVDTLTSDGCYEATVNKQILRPGPYPAGTEISAEVIAPLLQNAPQLRVSGDYPEWTLTYEDGEDQDFNDLVMTVTALP